MSFTTIRLQDERVIVKGDDALGVTNTTVIDGAQWFELKGQNDLALAEAEFNQTTTEFYATLTAAADKYKAARAGKTDSLNYIVVQEAEEGQAAKTEVIVQLTHDSKLLRLIEEDAAAPRLIWVTTGDNVSLEILAEAVAVPAPVSLNGLVSASAN